MDIVTRLENLSYKATDLKIKKEITLLIYHIKLLYKYGVNETGMTFEITPLSGNPRMYSQFSLITSLLTSILDEHKYIIISEYNSVINSIYPCGSKINEFLEHGVDLIEIYLAGENEVVDGNIFLGIEEKLKRANKSARDNNLEGLFSNLHTIIELLLKDKLGIALDMDGARLGKVLKICITEDIFTGKNNLLNNLFK